jgi:hypothetical protein
MLKLLIIVCSSSPFKKNSYRKNEFDFLFIKKDFVRIFYTLIRIYADMGKN